MNEQNFLSDFLAFISQISGQQSSYMIASGILFFIVHIIVTNQVEMMTRNGCINRFIGWMLFLIFICSMCYMFNWTDISKNNTAIFSMVGSFFFAFSSIVLLPMKNIGAKKIARALIYALIVVNIEIALLHRNYAVGFALTYGLMAGLCASMMISNLITLNSRTNSNDLHHSDSPWVFVNDEKP